MITRSQIAGIIARYSPEDIMVGTIGSHSALEICRGAKDEGLRTIVVCQRGREETYDRYYRVQEVFGRLCGVVDETIVLERFRDILRDDVQQRLASMNTIFIPHRSFTVYVPYDGIEEGFLIPIFGSRSLLRAEERGVEKGQYYLLEKAGIRTPMRFKDYREIDRLVLVKVEEAERTYEQAFFYASNPGEFEERARELLASKVITEEALSRAVIEEVVVGAHFNFNFFYSPLLGELELLGTDARRQTNLDGILRLPANEQLKVLKYVKMKSIEVGHYATTIRESLLEQAFELGERFVDAAKSEYPPGIIGPFALQGAVTPGPPKEEIVVFDVSLRVPGSPGTKFTHYTECRWGFPVSAGRRIAMEIREAVREGRLEEVVT